MIRAITKDGTLFLGLTRSTLALLEKGEQIISPAHDGHGPVVVLEFAETDKALREKLISAGRLRVSTREIDKRHS